MKAITNKSLTVKTENRSKTANGIISTVMALVMLCAVGCDVNQTPTESIKQGSSYYTAANASVYITEICSSNKNVLTDDEGQTSDYIEIYNATDGNISLKGYYLSDSEKNAQKWAFPDISIKSGEYMVVFASGLDRCADGYYHTNFSINAKEGETITLTCPDGSYASKITVSSCDKTDVSYGLRDDSDEFVWFAYPSPGKKNSGSNSAELDDLSFEKYQLIINEYMTGGDRFTDNSSEPCDFIEIYNYADTDLELDGFYLSDNPTEPDKWQFPTCTIKAGEYLTVCASGKNTVIDGQIHTSFKLSELDGGIILSDKRGNVIDQMNIQALPGNVSAGRVDDGIKYFTVPTPGSANNTTYTDTPVAFLTDGISIGRVSSAAIKSLGWSYDVITLVNTTQNDINIGGYSLILSKNKTYTFSDCTVKAGQELVLYASGEIPSKPEKNRIYLPFKVSVSGESIVLLDKQGKIRDVFETGKLNVGVVAYRKNAERYYQQDGNEAQSYEMPPLVLHQGGYIQSGQAVEVYAPDGVRVYYTTDGTEPSNKDNLYTAPITVEKGCSLRFIAYSDGKLPSDVVTRTFITEQKHDIPVMCISGDPDDYFSNERGIFAMGDNPGEPDMYKGANFWKDWEREAAFEYFTLDGSRSLEFNGGIKIHGSYSRIQKQKSMAVYLRNDYGCGDITYPFFENNQITTMGSFVLRTGGQDWNRGKLRDSFVAMVAKGTTELAIMDAAPVAVYFNGEYFGLYYLREKLGKEYFNYHYGIQEENLEYLRGNNTALHGTNTEYKALIEYVKTHDLSKQEYYQYVESQVDIMSYIDWWVMETWFVNTDSGNIKFFRDKESGKWKWVLFDMDWMLFRSTYQKNYLSEVYGSGHGASSMFSTVLIKGLLKNEGFKQLFIQRYSYHVQNTLNPDRLYCIINAMADQIRSEIPRQHARWGAPSLSSWEHTVYRLKVIFIEKIDLTKKHMRSVFKLSQAEVDELFTPIYDKENIQKQIDDYK